MDTSTNIYQAVMAHLRAKRIPRKVVATGAGVPFSTVTKIAQGEIKAPNVHHVQALYDYFEKQGTARVPQIEHGARTMTAAISGGYKNG